MGHVSINNLQVCSLHVPVGAGMEDLHAAVSDVVLGPEEDRWTKVRSQQAAAGACKEVHITNWLGR
jgi:hypothetical protein